MSARQWTQASWTTELLWLNETAGNRHHRLTQPSISALTSRIFRTHRTAITLLDDLDTKKPVADQTNLFFYRHKRASRATHLHSANCCLFLHQQLLKLKEEFIHMSEF